MRRATGTPASRSPLTDLEAELRALERRRREALRKAEREARFEAPPRVPPGAWTDLEHTIYLEQAA